MPQLQGIIQSALEVSPRMLIRRADSAATLANFQAEKSNRYPRAGGWADYYRIEDDRNDPLGSRPGSTLSYRFSIDQPLFQWGNITRNVRNARIRTLIDTDQTRQAYMSLAQDIRFRYLELIRTKRAIGRAELGLEINDAALQQAIRQRNENQGSESEVIAAELTKQRGQLAVAEANNSFERESRILARLTGSEPLSRDAVPDEFPMPDFANDAPIVISLLASFLASGDPENSEIVTAQRELEIAQNNHKNAKTALRPHFDLSAGVSQQDQDFALTANDFTFRQLFAGVSMRWSIWDSFATKARVRASLQGLRAAEIRLREKQLNLLDRADELGREIKFNAMRVSIAEGDLESAEGYLNYTRELRGRGEASEADVMAAELRYQELLENALWVRSNYWGSISDLLVMIELDPVLQRLETIEE